MALAVGERLGFFAHTLSHSRYKIQMRASETAATSLALPKQERDDSWLGILLPLLAQGDEGIAYLGGLGGRTLTANVK